MALYKVEVIGEAREVYRVEADSEEGAMARWASGELWVSENTGMEPVSASKVED